MHTQKKKVKLVEKHWRRNIKVCLQETGYEDIKWIGCFRPGSRAVLYFVMLVPEQWEVCVIKSEFIHHLSGKVYILKCP
jgi:hypothetical protein